MTRLRRARPSCPQQSTRRLPRRAAIVACGAVAGVALGCTTAYAVWTATGSGSGTSQARTFTAPTVSAGTATGTLLYPGLTSNGTSQGGDLAVSAANPNPFPVTVTVTQDGAATGCTTPAVTFQQGSFTLPANSGTVSRTLTYSLSMGANASNDCQGAAITVPLTTSSTSN